MGLIQRTLQSIIDSRDNIIKGNINSIPTPFPRFKKEFLGIQKGKMYVITAQTKASKTQFASFVFIYNTLFYAFHNPDKLKLKIFYFPLEETQEEVTLRFMCFLLYKLSNYTIIVSKDDLKSNANEPLDENILNLLNSEQYQKYLKFFEDTVIFSSTSNPTGIYKEVKCYVQDNGTIHYKKIPIKDDFGEIKLVDKFDYYEPKDPKEYVITFIDHIGELDVEQSFSIKENIDKLGKYLLELRNKYLVSPVVIQQQLVNEQIDNFKLDKLRPTITNLQDSKYLAQRANVVIGIFSPERYHLSEYFGYNIKIFKDNIRFIEILANRDGGSNGITALYFQGECCYFKQLPLPNSKEIESFYNKLKTTLSLFLVNFKK